MERVYLQQHWHNPSQAPHPPTVNCKNLQNLGSIYIEDEHEVFMPVKQKFNSSTAQWSVVCRPWWLLKSLTSLTLAWSRMSLRDCGQNQLKAEFSCSSETKWPWHSKAEHRRPSGHSYSVSFYMTSEGNLTPTWQNISPSKLQDEQGHFLCIIWHRENLSNCGATHVLCLNSSQRSVLLNNSVSSSHPSDPDVCEDIQRPEYCSSDSRLAAVWTEFVDSVSELCSKPALS